MSATWRVTISIAMLTAISFAGCTKPTDVVPCASLPRIQFVDALGALDELETHFGIDSDASGCIDDGHWEWFIDNEEIGDSLEASWMAPAPGYYWVKLGYRHGDELVIVDRSVVNPKLVERVSGISQENSDWAYSVPFRASAPDHCWPAGHARLKPTGTTIGEFDAQLVMFGADGEELFRGESLDFSEQRIDPWNGGVITFQIDWGDTTLGTASFTIEVHMGLGKDYRCFPDFLNLREAGEVEL